MADPFTVMCFSWNAAGLKLCETTSQGKADSARSGFKAKITLKQPCVAPDFFVGISDIIRSKYPSLVIMTTQDEDSNGTYFHSDVLPNLMPEIGYTLMDREKLDGVGTKASKISQKGVPTSEPGGSALRISTYVRQDVYPDVKVKTNFLSRFSRGGDVTKSKCEQEDRLSGAIVSHVRHPLYGRFAFVAIHLPSGVKALKIGNIMDYETNRAASVAANRLCLILLLNRLIDNASLQADHVFLMGDFNYDIVIPNMTSVETIAKVQSNISSVALKDLQRYDELAKEKEEIPLRDFKEGVANEGPLFMPTWRLARDRPEFCSPDDNANTVPISCFAAPDEDIRGIGWHDRILYKESLRSPFVAHCESYNRIDINNMNKSTNAGVIAMFDMKAMI